MSTFEHDFQLGLLPEKKWNWRTFAASYGLVTSGVLLLALFGIIVPETLQLNSNYHVTELVPRPSLVPEKPPQQPPTQPKVRQLAPVVQTARIVVPREVVAPKPQPKEVDPPKVSSNALLPTVLKLNGGARPVLIHTGEFQGSSAAPTLNAPIEKVQTGGFGDPNGLKPSANSKPGGKLIASVAGSFDMPVGPGQGNGSGGAKGLKGTVASADFGDRIATPGQGDGSGKGRGAGAVQSSGFATQQVAQNNRPQRADSGPASTGVEITDKPNPVYTEEARNLKIEGEVLLEVLFAASGHLQVSRVVQGLGHGLDEAAIAAANKMRFKPAMRNGLAVDSTAIVHVVFQLAY